MGQEHRKYGASGRWRAPILWAAPALLGVAVFLAPMNGEASPARKGLPATVSGTASVIDADTLEIAKQRIRLVGVDAPESGQKCLDANRKFYRCGSVSANALDQWINRNPVTCAIEDTDRYGRLLGQCSVRGENVQAWLVSNGLALAYRQYSTAYVPNELQARAARAGIWAGEFVAPWDWRQGLRLEGEKPTKAMISGKFAAD
ncbi:MAG: thermonuclease family protein [Hyphomonadaceae bacterium]